MTRSHQMGGVVAVVMVVVVVVLELVLVLVSGSSGYCGVWGGLVSFTCASGWGCKPLGHLDDN